MSLLQSIFGGAEPDAPSQALFETTVEVPKPRLAVPIQKKRKAPKEDDTKKEETNEQPDVETTTPTVDKDKEDRTIFVGNLPVSFTRKSLAALFADCGGKVESSRIRSAATTGVQLPPSSAGNQTLVKKVCTNTHKIDAAIKNSVHGYVVFCDAASVAVAIQTKNNSLVEGHNIRVDTASPTIDPQRSVFVGNLPYASQEETLRQHFISHMPSASSEQILGVRVVRDKQTFQCRGFAYVLLADKSLVSEALQKVHGTTYMKKELRVQVCGKRFKNKQGSYSAAEKAKRKSVPPLERLAESTGALKRMLTKQLVHGNKNSDANKRKRGDKKPTAANAKKAPNKAGVSKRQASAAKVGKREKTIQKRLSKGMGKQKKAQKG